MTTDEAIAAAACGDTVVDCDGDLWRMRDGEMQLWALYPKAWVVVDDPLPGTYEPWSVYTGEEPAAD